MIRSSTRRILLYGYVAVMLAALLLPVPDVPGYAPGNFDKLAHIGLFMGLALLLAWTTTGPLRRRVVVAVMGTVLFGAFTELLQGALPYRSGDPLDLAADLAGGIIGGLLGARLLPR